MMNATEPQALELYVSQEEAAAALVLERATAIEVKDDASYRASLAITGEAKERIARVKEEFAPAKEAAHKAHKAVCALEAKALGYYEQIVRALSPRQTAYLEAEERKRLAAETEANRKAEEERKRKEALAEDNRRKAEEARAAGEEKKAERYEARAEQQEESAATVPTVVIPPPRVEGVSTAKVWKAAVYDLEALLVCAVTGAEPLRSLARGCLKIEVAQREADRFAAMTKGATTLPGVRVGQVFQAPRQGRG